ncbi:MAG: PEP-CTERM sorting domain-containing protein [Opitutales bacterium]|nr:PEP-CTERM sorting domain-containing protein [Opitutales bacterium]
MKKLFILATCAIATIATAETFKGGASVGSRTPITAPSSESNSLVLDSTAGTYYSGINETIYKSVSSTGKVNMAYGGLTLDANTAEGNFKVMDVAGDWSMNLTYLFITNNAENNTATVEINANRFVFASSLDQSQTMSINGGKYTVNTADASVFSADQGTATLEIFDNTDVTWSGKLTMGKSSVFDLYGKVSFNKGALTIDTGSVANIYSGGHLYKTSSGYLYVNGTLNVYEGGKLEPVVGGNMVLAGTLNTESAIALTKISSSTGTYKQTAGSTTMKRAVNIEKGSWQVYEKLILEGSTHASDLSATCAQLTIADGVTFVIKNNENGKDANEARLLFFGYNNLVLNKKNAIVDENGKAVKLATVSQYKKIDGVDTTVEVINNKMTVNADQTFRSLYIASKSNLDIIMANDVVLEFTDTISFNTASTDGFLRIFNFQENSIKFNVSSTSVCDKIQQYIKLYGDTEEDFLGFANYTEDGFLTLITVPEPAEWAMLLGAIALGLAIYRRRK